jgi:hypothetical protein
MFHSDNKDGNSGFVTGVVATAALLAVCIYLFYTSKHAQRNRKFVKNIAEAAKIEIIERIIAAKKLSNKEYTHVTDTIIDAYHSIDGVTKNEIKAFIDEIKRAKTITSSKKKAIRKKDTSESVNRKVSKKRAPTNTLAVRTSNKKPKKQ